MENKQRIKENLQKEYQESLLFNHELRITNVEDDIDMLKVELARLKKQNRILLEEKKNEGRNNNMNDFTDYTSIV